MNRYSRVLEAGTVDLINSIVWTADILRYIERIMWDRCYFDEEAERMYYDTQTPKALEMAAILEYRERRNKQM